MSAPQSGLGHEDLSPKPGVNVRELVAESDEESDWEDVGAPPKIMQASVFLAPHKDLDTTWHSLVDDQPFSSSTAMAITPRAEEDAPPQACIVDTGAAPRFAHSEEFYESESDEEEEPMMTEARFIEAEDSDGDDAIEESAAEDDDVVMEEDLTPPGSPVVNEAYLDGESATMHSFVKKEEGDDMQRPVEGEHEALVKEDADDDRVLSLMEILRSSPPPPIPTASSPCELKSCLSRLVAMSEDDADGDSLLRSFETFRLVLAGLALGVFMSYFAFGLGNNGLIPERVVPRAPSTVFDVPATFLSGFAREAALCEKGCCFSLFILTGDSAAHEGAVLKAMNEVSRFRANQAKPVVWATEQLLAWTTGHSDEKGEVILVKNADVLATAEVQRIIRYGQRQCRVNPKSASSKILVLSTSFGSERLDDPDEVFSDRFVLDVKRRDWFVVPEIVLNFHGIVHGIRGKRPHSVFEEFLRTHRRRASPDVFMSESEFEHVTSPSVLLDRWLETKGASFAWTESARKVLASKVAQLASMPQVRTWLDSQYSEWTKNGSCESVLFRSSVSDVRAFTVACASSSLR